VKNTFDKQLKEVIEEVRNEIVTGEYSFVEERFGNKYWNIRKVIWFLAVGKVIQDQVPDGELVESYLEASDHFASVFDEGVETGKLSPLNELNLALHKPKTGQDSSLRQSLQSYFSHASEIISTLKSKSREQFVIADKGLKFALENGINIPARYLGLAERNSPDRTLADAEKHLEEPKDLIEKKRGKPGAATRWKKRDDLADQAEEFMKRLIGMDCLCNHEKLTDITYEMAKNKEGVLFADCDPKYFGLYGAMLRRAKLLVPKERRFGGRDYQSETCTCPIADHQNFKLTRYRE
jgi:hypothetical protein